jgi:hypothetical protein
VQHETYTRTSHGGCGFGVGGGADAGAWGENSGFAGLADQTAAAPGNLRILAVPVLDGRALEDLVWSWGNSEKPAGTPRTRRL